MSLTGLDPNRHTPGLARELVLGAGVQTTSGKTRDVLIFGNKTSAGTETVDTIGTAVLNGEDAIARFGRRSEWYQEYREYVAIDPTATIYGVAPTESAGTAATLTITFVGAATVTTTCKVTVLGQTVEFTVTAGDSITTIASACSTAINAADDSSLTLSASPSAGVVTLTASQLGPRGDFGLTDVTATFTKATTTTATVSAISAGTTEDDFTAAYAAAALGEYWYQVSPKHTPKGSPVAPTPTDNGIGEHIAMLQAQNLPVNGKFQQAFFGCVDTQANTSTVVTDSDANTVQAKFLHQKNSRWTPGMLAACWAAVNRSQQTLYPAANLTDYTHTDTTAWRVPDVLSKSSRLTATEIEADLRAGITPVKSDNRGNTSVKRDVTSRSLNANGTADYRAHEGHIPSVVSFFWDVLAARYYSLKQPNVDDDPAPGAKPSPLTDTPSSIRAIVNQVIDDLAGPRPLGLYPGPILAPSKVATMKAGVQVTRRTGGIGVQVGVLAVEHFLFLESLIQETSPAQ